MTISYGFYNSVTGDRVYDAIQMSRIFDGIILDGVYAALGDYFLVTENGTPDMTVLVGTGRAWFNHTWTYNDADVSLTVPTASPLLPRIDVVYLEVNEDTAVRANKVDILEGTPASSPVAPTLTNTTTVHQYPLAHIYVGVSVTSITQANITNKVGTAETPFVTCPLEYVTTDALLAEWEADWLEWFDDIKDQLSTEAETNLQAQIWDLAGVASGAPPYADDMVSLSTHDHSGSHPQIPTTGLAAGAVTESKIGTGAVTNTKLGASAVTSDKIATGGVGNTDLATDAVSTIKIQNLAVTESKIASGAITNLKIAANAVDTTQIANNAVTGDKIPNRERYVWIPALSCHGSGLTWNYEGAFAGIECPNTASVPLIYGSIYSPGNKRSGESYDMYVLWRPLTDANGSVRFHIRYYVTDEDFYMMNDGQYYDDATCLAPGYTSQMSKSLLVTPFASDTNGVVFVVNRDHDHAGDTNTGTIVVYGFIFEFDSLY